MRLSLRAPWLQAIAQERAPEPTVPPVPITILSKAVTGNVASTDDNLLNAASNQGDWLLYGRTYDNQRFSPASQIDRSNVKQLVVKAIIHTGVINSMEAHHRRRWRDVCFHTQRSRPGL